MRQFEEKHLFKMGRQGGRPQVLDKTKKELLDRLYDERQHSIPEICELVGISKSTLYTYLKKGENWRIKKGKNYMK